MGLIWVSPTLHSDEGRQHLVISSGLFPWFHAFLPARVRPPLSALNLENNCYDRLVNYVSTNDVILVADGRA
jgi:hypothetical protein